MLSTKLQVSSTQTVNSKQVTCGLSSHLSNYPVHGVSCKIM